MSIFAAALGLLVGFLVNYLADVLPTQRRLARPTWWPLSKDTLLMYLAKPRVWSVLIGLTVAAYVVASYPPADMHPVAYFLVLAYFVLVAVIDIEHRLVLHVVSLVGVLLLGSIGVARHGLVSTLLGGAAGFLGMLALYFLGEVVAKVISRRKGQAWDDVALGFGDVNLAGVIGLLMGWPGVLAAVFLGVFIGGIFAGAYMVWMLIKGKYSALQTIAYAPFLCLGATILLTLGVYS